ncbi:MAG: hypothetical protein FWF94_07345 [Oscillospiraceae bacterium]|nr:hypothetical protein [Oscillospiraceae bacterium]
MKKTITALIAILSLTLSVCSCTTPAAPPALFRSVTFEYHTFEEALTDFATDVVKVHYIAQKPFGEQQSLTEYEFTVLDRVLGNAADTIFVYTEGEENIDATFIGTDKDISYTPGDLEFNTESTYLIILQKILSPLASTQDDGYTFLDDIVIDLEKPSNSRMYSEALDNHSDDFRFNDHPSEDEIIGYIKELTNQKQEPIYNHFPENETTENILKGSPYVLSVEVGELFTAPRTDWMSTDVHHVTVTKVFKGDILSGHECLITFTANSVKVGEQYIVAVEPIEEGYDDWFRLTSVNSLFDVELQGEILKVLLAR